MKDKSKRLGSAMDIGGAKPLRVGSGALDKETQIKIGQQLRAMYDEVVRQGVPDRFASLLQRLERKEEESSTEYPSQLERQEDEESKP